MGQAATSKLSKEVCARLRDLPVDDVLHDDVLLRQATTAVTAAFTHYRFRLNAVRGKEENNSETGIQCSLGGIKLLDSGVSVNVEGARIAEGSTSEELTFLDLDGFLDDNPSDNKGWTGKVLVIIFPEPRAVTEFKFRTQADGESDNDPIRFYFEGSANSTKWCVLCDQTKSDFDTPNMRGAWTRTIDLHDTSVDTGRVGARAAAQLSKASEEGGARDLALWISGEPPRAPVQEATALMECCRAQLVGTRPRRRDVFFSMLYSASESAWNEKMKTEELMEQQFSLARAPVEPLTALSSISMRCMVQVILGPGLEGPQAEAILDMVNAEVEKGMAGVDWPVDPSEVPEALKAGLSAVSDILHKTLAGGHPQSVRIVELLLRSAILRGRWDDVLTSVTWLIQLKENVDVGRLWPVAEALRQVLIPWAAEIFHDGRWSAKAKGTMRTAERSPVPITDTQLKGLGATSAYAEVTLISDAANCRICLVPCVAGGVLPSDFNTEVGLAFESGKAFMNGEEASLGWSSPRPFKNGDVVGVALQDDCSSTLSVNGETWGKLPRCPQLDNSGCSIAVRCSTTAQINLNAGVFAFKHLPSSARPWIEVGGIEGFDAARKRLSEKAADECEALAVVLLETLAHRKGRQTKTKVVEQIYESAHPYRGEMNESQRIHIPGAQSMRIVFSPQCNTRGSDDFMRIGLTESAAISESGARLQHKNWPTKEIQGDTFWYFWHTCDPCDSDDESSSSGRDDQRWGWKFTVEAEVDAMTGDVLVDAVQINKAAVEMLTKVMRTARSDVVILAAVNCIPSHLEFVKNLPNEIVLALIHELVGLLRRKDEIGAQAATCLGANIAELAQDPSTMLDLLLRVWSEEDAFHPDVFQILGPNIASSSQLFGKLVDQDDTWNVVARMASALGKNCRSSLADIASQILRHALSDGVFFVLAGRAAQPQKAWGRVLGTVQEIMDVCAQEIDKLNGVDVEAPPVVIRKLLLPVLHGMSAISQFNSANWDDVASLVPYICKVVLAAKGKLPAVHSAGLALVAALGKIVVSADDQQQVANDADGVAEVLKSPLFRGVPRHALVGISFAPPSSVQKLESFLGMHMLEDKVSSQTIVPAFQEILDGTSSRASELVNRLESESKGPVKIHVSVRAHRLLFCLLLKQSSSVVALQNLLQGTDSDCTDILKLWMAAHQLELWLLSTKQRLVNLGRAAEFVVEVIEKTLELALACDPDAMKWDRKKDADVGMQAILDAARHQARPRTPSAPLHPSQSCDSMSSGGSPAKGIDKLKRWADKLTRLKALLLSTRNKQARKLPGQHLKEIFETTWIRNDDPVGKLISGIQQTTAATWWRVVGISLLAWAVEQCSQGAESWAAAVATSGLAEAWRKTAHMPKWGAEATSQAALTAARLRAAKAMASMCCAGSDGRQQGNVLQVMGLAALVGPWLDAEHSVALDAGVLDTVRSHLPWVSCAKATQIHRAAWLCIESLACMKNAGGGMTPLSRSLLTLLLDALPKAPKTPASVELVRPSTGLAGSATQDSLPKAPAVGLGRSITWTPGVATQAVDTSDALPAASGGSSSLVALFFAKPSKNKSPKEDLVNFFEDLRSRLQKDSNCFGPGYSWEDWLSEMRDTFMKWFEQFKGYAPLEQMTEYNADPVDFDFNNDGAIDCYEYLHLIHQSSQLDKASVPEWASARVWQIPLNFPRYVGDAGGVTSENEIFQSIGDLPVPPIVKNAEFAILRALDVLARTQQATTFFSDEHVESLVQIAVDPKKAVPGTLAALRLLRRLTDLPSTILTSASWRLLGALASDPQAPTSAQRADLLRAWMADSSSCNMVVTTLSEALQSPSDATSFAALRVIGAPAGLNLLCPALLPSKDKAIVLEVSPAGIGETSITIFCEGTDGVDVTPASSLHLFPEKCDPSCFGKADQKVVVDTVLKFRKDQAWALDTVLLEPDAAEYFVANGHFKSWLPIALGKPLVALKSLSPSERSSVSTLLRLDCREQYELFAARVDSGEEGPQVEGDGIVDPYEVEVRTHPHPLVQFHREGWSCDGSCENCSFEAEGQFVRWRSVQCDYDMCRACMRSARKAPPNGKAVVEAAVRVLGGSATLESAKATTLEVDPTPEFVGTTLEVDPMAEFVGMNLKAVKEKASLEGIGQEEVEAADDEEDPREAVIQLILQNRKASAEPPSEKISFLRREALRIGVSQEEVDSALEMPDLRQSLTALIRSKQADKVGYTDKDGDRVDFGIEDGNLIKYVNGNKLVGEDDSSGVVTSLSFEDGSPADVRDQHGYGSDDFPWEVVQKLKQMADEVGVPNNLPDRAAQGEDDTSVQFSQMLTVARACMAEPPEKHIRRLAALRWGSSEESATSHEDKFSQTSQDTCGMAKAIVDTSTCSAAASVLKECHENPEKLDALLWDAVQWDRHVLALNVCLSCIHHIAAKEEPLLDQFTPEHLIQLSLSFNKNLDSESAKSQARSEMLGIARQNRAMVLAARDSALAHLLGSLGDPPPTLISGAGRTYESPHPYLNDMNLHEVIYIPGAQKLRIIFDRECETEPGCDTLYFQADMLLDGGVVKQEASRSGSGWVSFDKPEIIVYGNRCEFRFVSDCSQTYWGYKFTVIPLMLAETADTSNCSLSDGLWLLDFLLDLPPDENVAVLVLRAEIAAALLAHAERRFDERLSSLIQKFLNSCKLHHVDLNWDEAQHMLKSLTKAAPKPSILQRIMALRLALPDVRVMPAVPRFKCLGSGAMLSKGGQVCTAHVFQDVYCCLPKRMVSACFKLGDRGKVAWIGAITFAQEEGDQGTRQRSVEKDNMYMLNLATGVTQSAGEVDESNPMSGSPMGDVQVDLDISALKITFSAAGSACRVLQLPVAIPAKGWRLAARLCEFGSSVEVDAAIRVDSSAVEELQAATDAVKAVHLCERDWSDEFTAEAFGEWRQASLADDDADASTVDWGSLQPEEQLLVWGAGLPEFNGVFTRADDCWSNDAGCKVAKDQHDLWVFTSRLDDATEVPKYVACFGFQTDFKSTPTSDEPCDSANINGPCISVAEDAGLAPKFCHVLGPERMQTLATFDPAAISSSAIEEHLPVQVTQVVEVGEGKGACITVATFNCADMSCLAPTLLSYTSGGSYKTVPGVQFRHFGKTGWVFCHTFEWKSEGKQLFFCAGDGYSKVALCVDNERFGWDELASHCVETVESPRPLPPGQVTKLKMCIPGVNAMNLQLSADCGLDSQALMLVTLDDAGKHPAILKQDDSGATWGEQERNDASRGMVTIVKDQKFWVNAGECFLHLPVSRLVRWEPQSGETGSVQIGSGRDEESEEELEFDIFADEGEQVIVKDPKQQPDPVCGKQELPKLMPQGEFGPAADGLLYFRRAAEARLDADPKALSHEDSRRWTVHWEHGESATIALERGRFECGGAYYQLRATTPVSFVWADGTVQTVESFDGSVVTWSTTSQQRIRWVLQANIGTVTKVSVGELRRQALALGATVDETDEILAENDVEKRRDDMSKLVKAQEKRLGNDNAAYTKAQFIEFYGEEDGQTRWNNAKPYEDEAAGAESEVDAEPQAEPNVTESASDVALPPETGPESVPAPTPVTLTRALSTRSPLPTPLPLERQLSAPLRNRMQRTPEKMPADEIIVEVSEEPFAMRHSFSAMTWLRPGVLAGEVAIDFMEAPLAAGDLAIGVVGACSLTSSVLRWQVSDDSLDDGQWWWRCDGRSRTHGQCNQYDASATFGAGDVIGIVALIEDQCLRLLEVRRNGSKISTWRPEQPDAVKLIQGDAPSVLAFCAAFRLSSTSVSLLPSPQLMLKGLSSSPVLALARAASTDSANRAMDIEEERAFMTAVFEALDADGDGLLSRQEVATALGSARNELFEELDTKEDGQVSPEAWECFCFKLKDSSGAIGLALFLNAFRKRLAYLGRAVAVSHQAGDGNAWGVKVTATPRDAPAEFKMRMAKEFMSTEWTKFKSLAIDGWSRDLDVQLVKMINWVITEKFPQYSTSMDQLKLMGRHELRGFQAEWKKKFPLLQVSQNKLEARFIAIRLLNSWITARVLPYCDLGDIQNVEFGRALVSSRSCFLQPLKMQRFNEIVGMTGTDSQKSISLSRTIMTECKDNDECDELGCKMFFAQASKLAEGIGVTLRSYDRPLKITYVGEDGIDAGGLYRDFLDTCAIELCSSNLPILVPTPNNRTNSGECREAWQISPKAMTQATRRMLSFLGQLIGICLRRGDVMPIALSQLNWKLLVGEEVGLDDLACEDIATSQTVEHFLNLEQLGVTAEPGDFESAFGDMRYEFHNSAGEMVPLGKRGAAKCVTFKNAKKFADLVLKMRLSEASEQIACIRAGMALVVPIGCLSLWGWRDLEMAVCGNPYIDVAVLRKHAEYEDGYTSDSTPVKLLWETLESFSQDELSYFLRFVWGRSRLPPEGSRHWEEGGFKVTKHEALGPLAFPRAHTCFFQLELPPYETGQIAKEKILYAVKNCTDMQNE